MLEEQLAETQAQIAICAKELSESRIFNQENMTLKRKYHMAELHIENVKCKMASKTLSIDAIKSHPDKMRFYTGFANYKEFLVLFNFLLPDIHHLYYWGSTQCKDVQPSRGSNRTLSAENELLLVLTRLRLGLLHEDIAFR